MARAGGGLEALASLVLLGLYGCTSAWAAAPDPVRNLRKEAQTTSNITLSWDPPLDTDTQNVTYWVQCTGDGGRNDSQSTGDTRITVDGLDPASSYEFSVWVEKDGVNSSRQNLSASTAPNPVRNLSVEGQTNSSISLHWEVPEGPNSQSLTYWVQCIGDGDTEETRNTRSTNITVDALVPASLYNCSVWAEMETDGISSTKETLQTATAPNPVRNLSVEGQTNSSISLHWEVPEGPNSQSLTYWVQCIGDGDTEETRNTRSTNITVDALVPASLYNCSVWAEMETDGISSTKETLQTATAPNPVRNLSVEGQTNSSISLHWEVPEGPNSQSLTYWVQCIGDGDTEETRNTRSTNITVDALVPASLYNCSVWAEMETDGISSTKETLQTATAPNPVRNLSVEGQTNSSISLHWEVPEGPNSQSLTYWVQCIGDGDTEETRNTRSTNITVDALVPASLYNCSVWAEMETDGISSTKETLQTATAPNPVTILSVTGKTNSSITLRWETPSGPDAHGYTYWVQWTGDSEKSENQSTTDTRVTAEGLEAGTLYGFSVRAEKNRVPSTPQNLSDSTVPNPVMNLRIQNQTNSSITLNWIAPMGPSHPSYTYRISWTQENSTAVGSQTALGTNTTVTALQPGGLYSFTVSAERNQVRSNTRSLTGATEPNKVTGLQYESQTNNSVTLKWNAPADPYYEHYSYWVQWDSEEQAQREQASPGRSASSTISTRETWCKIENLKPGTLYNFRVWADSSNKFSSTQTLQASTVPGAVTTPSCVSTSGGYGVILTWSCPSGGYESFEVEVGRQRSSQDKSLCGTDISVTGLGPAQSYTATITTVWKELRSPSVSLTCSTDSADTVSIKNKQSQTRRARLRETSEGTGVIAGAIVGVLLFFILLGLLIFFLRKRKKKPQQKEVPRDLLFSFPGNILSKDFAEHVRKNEKDSNYGFAEEYQQLALEGQGQAQLVASAPENKSKNRYANVLPYDWSRVPLKLLHEEPGSDYINASFMPGLRGPKEFIAAQGPLPHTVGDFWRLVWEQQSHTLVMLTNCIESGRVKCEHYWPLDAQPCCHGQLRVTLLAEDVTENWTVRELQLYHMESQKTLFVRQFHYLAWPDHGVPYSPDPLLAFWKVIRQWLDQTTGAGPPIIHCSAGVGRTGTLIALDVLLRQLECEGQVGPLNFVRKMRENRPLMVQTEAQYVFLHQCILRFLQQSAPDPTQEATYENVSCVIYENTAAIQAHELEA